MKTLPVSTTITKPPMTEEEAVAAHQRIAAGLERFVKVGMEVGDSMREFHELEGWRHIRYAAERRNYDSFKEYCEVEFRDRFGDRSTIYRLIQQSAVSSNVGAAQVPITHAQQLAKLPAAAQAKVYTVATKEAGGAPTAEGVAKAVQGWKKSNVAPAKKTRAIEDAAMAAARARIVKVCGKQTGAAIEHQLDQVELIAFAKRSDEQMKQLQEIVASGRMKPVQAVTLINTMPTGRTTMADLVTLALADGGKFEATLEGFDFSITRRKGKK